ncbi:unnamed protein product (macronuclear) [Paramecium tetraurelia]|uniref:B30.2/SPRY domain-containing protein n=1 Tax=Paramecium tetraurelia TaxID=5888 RepID=A0CFQ7_PARTE|nr:uncharacterized protein GSPATT00038065001 [Paramecium tetraurelia]CAK69624.1 unnamed protein product [Paramecium tetraurelia]|eukprot:XP_001437021.1 hypothetical protein (macronuclear) [Paramecium tetraurelia strain d4-2]
MSFEISEKMIVNTIAGFGQVIKLPEGPAPEQLIAEEELQLNHQQSAEKPVISCPSSPAPPEVKEQANENAQQADELLEKKNEKQIEKQLDNQQEKQNQVQAQPAKNIAPQKDVPENLPNLPPPLNYSRQSSQQPSQEKQLLIAEDPLPFSNSLPFQQQSSVESQPQNKKAPILKRLTCDLKESLALAKKLEIKYKYPYSNDERLITIDFQLGQITTMVKHISNVIFLLVKTFFGQRNYYLAIVPVNYTVEQLRSFIIDGIGQNQKMFHNIKLIHPMIQLKELKDSQIKLSEVGLKDFSQLIFLAEMTFTWDPIKKGKSVILSNNNLTANKKGQSDYQTVLGTLALNSGRHYWEIKIEKYVDEEDIFIGIARKEIDLYTQPTTTGHFYGYICLCARKFGADGQISDYGYSAVQNDTIGVLLEFRSGIGTLSFYRNGVKCGEAFNNLTGTFYPALSMFYGEVQVTLDSKAPLPAS